LLCSERVSKSRRKTSLTEFWNSRCGGHSKCDYKALWSFRKACQEMLKMLRPFSDCCCDYWNNILKNSFIVTLPGYYKPHQNVPVFLPSYHKTNSQSKKGQFSTIFFIEIVTCPGCVQNKYGGYSPCQIRKPGTQIISGSCKARGRVGG
jgi:hypothetical protein